MKKRLSALLLSFLLCLTAAAPALAAETHSVEVNTSGLTAGYYMGAVWDGGTLLALFDATVGSDGALKQTVDLGDTPLSGSTVKVSLSQPNAASGTEKILTNVPVKTSGSTSTTPGGNTPSDPSAGAATYYSIYRNVSSNGSIGLSTYSAASGETVSIYVYPNSGYELSSLWVTGSNGRDISTYHAGTDRYTFIMPARDVTVYANFSWIPDYSYSYTEPTTSGTVDTATIPIHQSFADTPATHWALKGSSWAYDSGVMEDIGTGPNGPDGTVTRRQLWMAMSRMAGNWPADMTEARDWAVRSNLSDGSNPTGTLTRQQLALAMYAYVELSGYELMGGVDLTAYPDYRSVSSGARTALAWAIDYKIILPTEDGRLNPTGAVTYSQLAVILDRLYNGYLYVRSQNSLC